MLCFLNFPFMVRYFALYTIYGAVMTLTAFFQRIYTQNLQITLLDAVRALWMCLLESMCSVMGFHFCSSPCSSAAKRKGRNG